MLAQQQTLSEALKFRHQIKYPYQVFRLGLLFVVGLSKSANSILDLIKHYWFSIIPDEMNESPADLILSTCPIFNPSLDFSDPLLEQLRQEVRGNIHGWDSSRRALVTILNTQFSELYGTFSYFFSLAYAAEHARISDKHNIGDIAEAIGESIVAFARLQIAHPNAIESLQEVIVGEKKDNKVFLAINANAPEVNTSFIKFLESLQNQKQAFICDSFGNFSGTAPNWVSHIFDTLPTYYFSLTKSNFSRREACSVWPVSAVKENWSTTLVVNLTMPRESGDFVGHFLTLAYIREENLILRETDYFEIPSGIRCVLMPVGPDTYFRIEAEQDWEYPVAQRGGIQMRVQGVSSLDLQKHIDKTCTVRYDFTLLLANYWHMFVIAAMLSFALPIVRVYFQKNNTRKRHDFFCKKNIAKNVAVHSAIGSMIMMGLLWRHNQPGYLHITALLLNVALAIAGQLVAANCFEEPKEPLAEHKRSRHQQRRKR